MNKIEAAAFLGVSVRALERYTAQNRVAARYEKGKTRSVLVYDQGELERFKGELDSEVHRPTVEISQQNSANFANDAKPANALATFGEFLPSSPNFGPLLQLLQAAHEAGNVAGGSEKHPVTPTQDKLLLTLEEAGSLTGLSRAILMEAVKSGALRARKIGKAWRIKRRDLDAFIDDF